MQEIRGNADRMKEIDKRVAALEERIGKLAPAPVSTSGSESPREWRSPEEMYEFAVGQVKGGNPKKGRETLSDFATKYPNHKLIPNALYWKARRSTRRRITRTPSSRSRTWWTNTPGGKRRPTRCTSRDCRSLR